MEMQSCFFLLQCDDHNHTIQSIGKPYNKTISSLPMPRAFVLVLIRKNEQHISMEGVVSSEEKMGDKDWLVGEQLV